MRYLFGDQATSDEGATPEQGDTDKFQVSGDGGFVHDGVGYAKAC